MRDQKPIKATRTLHDFWNTPASSSSATTSGTTAPSGLANASKVQQSNSHQHHAPVFPARVQPSIKNIDSGDTVHLSDDDDDLLLAHAIKLESLQKKRDKPATAEEWQEFLPGFDVEAGQYWLYPKNKPKREYQYAIVRTALFHNTLVSLPTGLGKTFIAAVVMYNFYRWYPNGKVLFVAPTRPLVEQQIEACYNIVGIPQKDMCALTGKKNQKAREEDWRNHRVFFLTPHVLAIDLERNVFPTDDIKCLVIDEAHKSTGNYVSCQAVQRLLTDRVKFRVLALSATPGNDLRHVQQVINNLLIAKVETRTENSLDVKPYIFGRTEEKLIVRLEGDTKRLKDLFESGLQPMIDNLRKHRVVEATATVDDFSLFKIKLASDLLRSRNMDKRVKGSLMGQCAVLQSLYHSYDLLIRHGLRALYRHLNETMKTNHLLRSVIDRSEPLTCVWEFLSDRYSQMTDVSLNASIIGGPRNSTERAAPQALDSIDERVLNSHPKMKHLGEVLNAHFSQNVNIEDDKSTRAIVFSSYRDSVDEIADFLRRLKPLIRPTEFKGQQSKRPVDAEAGPRRGQAEQLRTIQDFQSGKFNVLVSTCVGEEGLDIGEVDLIICYDTNTSGIRQVQRMGRTGRKRQGRIVHLLTERWEEKNYNRASKKNKTVQSAMNLAANVGRFELFADSPRMIPLGLTPTAQEVEMAQSVSFVREADRKRRLRPGDGLAAAKQAFYACAGYLTEKEMAEWDRRYKTEFQPAVKRRACMISLGDRQQSNAVELSSHLLWQDREQPVGRVKHSALTSRFVAFMRGAASGGRAASFRASDLNEEDILRPGQADGSLPPVDDVVDVDVDMEAEMAQFDAAASSTLVRKPLRVVQAEQKKPKATKKQTLQKKTAVKGRGGKRKCGGKEEGKGAERKEESTIEFIEMRRPVTEGDFVDVRDAAVVAERADRLRVLLGLLDAQCELLDWRDYLDDSFDSLISGIEDVDAQQPIPHHPDPPAAHDDSRLSVDAAVRMLFVERSADRSLDRSVNQGGILDHSLDSSVNQGGGVLDRTMDRDGNPDHSLDRTVERVGILERSTDRSLDHSVNQGGILDRTGEHVGILDHSADRSLDLAEAEASHLAHAESTSGAVDYGYGCLDPSIVTEPCRSDPLSSIIQTAAYGNNVTPLPPAKPLRPTATTSMLGFDFNTPARRDEGAVVKQHSLTSMTTTALQFNLMTPLNESRQLTTSGGGGLNRLFANPTTYAPPRDVRVEPLRNDEALPSQTTPVRLLRSASGSNTSLGFNFHTPLVAEGGQGSESRPSMVTTLGFSFAAQSHSPLVAASDRRSCSPPSPITASDHAEDTVPPSPNALTSGGKRHQLLGGLSLRF